jgi:Ca-activated chloride channel homolog
LRDRRPALISAGLAALLLLAGWVWRPAAAACTSIIVASSNEKASTLKGLARQFSDLPRPPGECVSVQVNKVASGAAESRLLAGWTGPDRPDVWSPAASTWVELLRDQLGVKQNLLPVAYASLAESPLVIGMPQPMAEALGWPGVQPSWPDLLLLSQDSRGWGRYGHPEWGRFSLGQTDPRVSTSGLHALIATYYAATGRAGDLAAADVTGSQGSQFVQAIEAGVAHYSDTAENFLLNLKAADDAGTPFGYISAVTLEEQELWQYNQGQIGDALAPPPRVKLKAIYPQDGTLMADHPYLVLNGISPGKARLAGDFLAWLQLTPQQQVLANAGFRVQDSQSNVAGVALAGQPARELRSPAARVVSLIQQSWSTVRKRARVLIVMDATIPSVRARVVSAIGQLAANDEVGVWAVGPDEKSQPYKEARGIGPIGNDPSQLKAAMSGITPERGNPPLLAGIEAAFNRLKANPDPSRVNAVLVVAGGRNDGSRGPDLVSLLGEVRSDPQGSTIRVFGVSTSAEDDSSMNRIAQASGGVAYTAHKGDDVANALQRLVADF